jgi:hypothetical protein
MPDFSAVDHKAAHQGGFLAQCDPRRRSSAKLVAHEAAGRVSRAVRIGIGQVRGMDDCFAAKERFERTAGRRRDRLGEERRVARQTATRHTSKNSGRSAR